MIEARGGKNNALKFVCAEKDPIYNNQSLSLVSICDLYIFDENGNLAVSFKNLMDCTIDISSSGGTISANDCEFRFDLFKFLHDFSKKSDYDFLLNPQEFQRVVYKKGDNRKKCKLILVAEARNNQNEAQILKYNFSNCFIQRDYSQQFAANGLSVTTLKIYVEPDENGNLFEMIF